MISIINGQAKLRAVSLISKIDMNVPQMLYTDGKRLRQILFNLIGNAFKFSFVGGIIEISVKSVQNPQ